MADRGGFTFAKFVMLAQFPGTVDFEKWEKGIAADAPKLNGIPMNRYWLLPPGQRPKTAGIWNPVMSEDEIRRRTQGVWDRFYALNSIWRRSRWVKSFRSRVAFVLISKLYRQMYANTGMATDSARVARANRAARFLAKLCRCLFVAKPLPNLQAPRPKAA